MNPLGRQGSDIGLAGQRLAQEADGWRASQSCHDVPTRFPGGVSVGHVTSVFKGEVVRVDSHAKTLASSLARCGTSFVNLGFIFFAFYEPT